MLNDNHTTFFFFFARHKLSMAACALAKAKAHERLKKTDHVGFLCVCVC